MVMDAIRQNASVSCGALDSDIVPPSSQNKSTFPESLISFSSQDNGAYNSFSYGNDNSLPYGSSYGLPYAFSGNGGGTTLPGPNPPAGTNLAGYTGMFAGTSPAPYEAGTNQKPLYNGWPGYMPAYMTDPRMTGTSPFVLPPSAMIPPALQVAGLNSGIPINLYSPLTQLPPAYQVPQSAGNLPPIGDKSIPIAEHDEHADQLQKTIDLVRSTWDGAFLMKKATENGYTLESKPEDLAENTNGVTNHGTKMINIQDPNDAAVLAHELVHAASPDDGNSKDEEGIASAIGIRVAQQVAYRNGLSPQSIGGTGWDSKGNAQLAYLNEHDWTNQDKPNNEIRDTLDGLGVSTNDIFGSEHDVEDLEQIKAHEDAIDAASPYQSSDHAISYGNLVDSINDSELPQETRDAVYRLSRNMGFWQAVDGPQTDMTFTFDQLQTLEHKFATSGGGAPEGGGGHH